MIYTVLKLNSSEMYVQYVAPLLTFMHKQHIIVPFQLTLRFMAMKKGLELYVYIQRHKETTDIQVYATHMIII